jgi:nicotinamide mononucleotide transporter
LNDLLTALVQAAAAMTGLEVVAVVLAVVYLLLAIRQSIWCWTAAILSCLLYIWIMYRAGLYMESALQVFYIGMAVYGWYSWRHGPGKDHSLLVSSWPPVFHLVPILLVVALTALSGFLLTAYSDAAWPYLDSFTTWAAIVATWMVARKILQNWHYWFVIDAISVYLYASRDLWLTALLFVLYLVLILVGYRSWRRSMALADA